MCWTKSIKHNDDSNGQRLHMMITGSVLWLLDEWRQLVNIPENQWKEEYGH